MAKDQTLQASDGDEQVQSREVVRLSDASEPVTLRIRRLQWEAKVLAAEHAEGFGAEMLALAGQAREIADGGDAYPPGVRELALRIAVDLEHTAKSLVAIVHQVGPRS